MNTIIVHYSDGTAAKAEAKDRETRRILKGFLKEDRLIKIEIIKK